MSAVYPDGSRCTHVALYRDHGIRACGPGTWPYDAQGLVTYTVPKLTGHFAFYASIERAKEVIDEMLDPEPPVEPTDPWVIDYVSVDGVVVPIYREAGTRDYYAVYEGKRYYGTTLRAVYDILDALVGPPVQPVDPVEPVEPVDPPPLPLEYKCPYCDVVFSTEAELMWHIETAHPEEPPVVPEPPVEPPPSGLLNRVNHYIALVPAAGLVVAMFLYDLVNPRKK